eukprot:jgi/Botrbrau1/13729/Bobra.0356s0009.1
MQYIRSCFASADAKQCCAGRQMQYITPDAKQCCADQVNQAGNTVLPGQKKNAAEVVHQLIL